MPPGAAGPIPWRRVLLGVLLGSLLIGIIAASVAVSFKLSRRTTAGASPREEASVPPAQGPETMPQAMPGEPPPTGLVPPSVPPEPAPAPQPPLPDAEPSQPPAEPAEPEADVPSPPTPDPTEDVPSPPTPDPTGDAPAGSAPREPFDAIEAKNRLVAIPPPGPKSHEAGPVDVAQIFVDSAAVCELALAGGEIVLDKGLRFQVECIDAPDGTRTWTVLVRTEFGFVEGQAIAVFSLKDRLLKFVWTPTPAGSLGPLRLPFCLLRLKVGEKTVDCFLRKPDEVPPAKIDGAARIGTYTIAVDPRALPPEEHLRVELAPEGFPKHEIDPDTAWKLGQTGTVRFLDPSSGETGVLDVEVVCRVADQLSLRYEIFGYPHTVRRDGHVEVRRTQMDRKRTEEQQREWSRRKAAAERDLTVSETRKTSLDQQKADLEQSRPRSVSSSSSSISYRLYQEYLARKSMLSLELAAVEQRVENCKQIVAAAEAGEDWAKNVTEIFDQLETGGSLGLCLYVEIEGEKVELLRTNSKLSIN